MEWSVVHLKELIVAQPVKKFHAFYGIEYSLPCLYGPSTGPDHDENESKPQPHIHFL
jgi:hypothetical protein